MQQRVPKTYCKHLLKHVSGGGVYVCARSPAVLLLLSCGHLRTMLHPSLHLSQQHSARCSVTRVTHYRHCRGRQACLRVLATAGDSSSKKLNVVITGASKGLGFAMAHQFLRAGDTVLLCARNQVRLEAAVQHLQQHAVVRPAQLHAVQCDVSQPADVQRFTEVVSDKLGRVDRWINNAGQVTQNKVLSLVQPDELQNVVGVNVLGSLLCCRAAVLLMQQYHEQQQQQQQQQQQHHHHQQSTHTKQQQQQQQQALYHIFNCGFSGWGAQLSKSACTHKATKMALTQLNRSLAEELTAARLGYIGVHNLSPGMVLTDLLLQGASPTARRFFNALAEEPDTVAADLVPRIRAVKGTNTRIDYLTPAAAVAKIVAGVPQIINGGRFFDKEGNRRGLGKGTANPAGVRLLYDFPADKY